MSSRQDYILAIDLGSTSFKASIFTSDLTCLASGGAPVPHEFAQGGRCELPVRTAETAFREAIAATLKEAGLTADQLTAIAFDSQAQTFTVCTPTGQARMPFISWQDNRATAANDALAADPTLATFGDHCSFNSLCPPLQLCQLRHLMDEKPDWLQPTDMVIPLPTYFVQAISGQAVIDNNLAAMSGLFSLVENDWWAPALTATCITRQQLPAVVPVGTIATHTSNSATAYGLPAGIPIILAGNDQTAGGYGANVAAEQAVLITLGTAQVAYSACDTPAQQAPAVVRGPYPGDLHYALVCDMVGGSVINWAQNMLPCDSDPQSFFSLAAQADPGCGGVTFVSDLHAATGSWQGIGFQTTPADLARSIVESLSQRMVALVHQMPVEKPRFLIAGGGSKSELWRSILGEALGNADLTPIVADPLLGSARMAADTLLANPTD